MVTLNATNVTNLHQLSSSALAVQIPLGIGVGNVNGIDTILVASAETARLDVIDVTIPEAPVIISSLQNSLFQFALSITLAPNSPLA